VDAFSRLAFQSSGEKVMYYHERAAALGNDYSICKMGCNLYFFIFFYSSSSSSS
jgi:hypothetical protein